MTFLTDQLIDKISNVSEISSKWVSRHREIVTMIVLLIIIIIIIIIIILIITEYFSLVALKAVSLVNINCTKGDNCNTNIDLKD